MTDHFAEALAAMLAIALVITSFVYERYVRELKQEVRLAEDHADRCQDLYTKSARSSVRLIRDGESA